MKLFFIRKNLSQNLNIRDFLEEACINNNIDFLDIIPEDFNFLEEGLVKKWDLLYRSSSTHACRAIESFVLTKWGVSFHKNPVEGINFRNDSFLFNKMVWLPIIPTIPDLSNKGLLEQYVEHLGWFPVVLKVTWWSHGVGVMKVDSISSLRSIIDYLESGNTKFILRRFVQHHQQGRLVVVGNKVIASDIAIMSISHDFRSNIGDDKTRVWEAKTYSAEIQDLAVNAVNSFGVEFWGVDILFEESTERPYVSEVNFPCDFSGTQKKTNINIADIMIKFLIGKVNK